MPADTHLTLADLADLCQQAETSSRRRRHRNLHASPFEPCQRLINAVGRDSYIRPHRHSGYVTNECLIALRGRFVLIEFDSVGSIVAALRMGGPDADVVIAEVPPGCWHTIVALEDGSVLFEAKSGPFNPDAAKHFAPWAPGEDTEDAPAYLAGLRDQGLSIVNQPFAIVDPLPDRSS